MGLAIKIDAQKIIYFEGGPEMAVEGNEKISVNYQLIWLQTYAPYKLEVLQRHSNYEARAHPVDYEGIASNVLMNAASFPAWQHTNYSQEKESNISDYLDSHTDQN